MSGVAPTTVIDTGPPLIVGRTRDKRVGGWVWANGQDGTAGYPPESLVTKVEGHTEFLPYNELR